MKRLLFSVIIILFSLNELFCQTNTFPSSGSVGIGTTTPQGNLDIYNPSNAASIPLISIRSNFNVVGNYGMIRFGDYTQTTAYQKGAIIYESVSGAARGRLHIALENTDGNGTVALSDAKLTVLSNGNIGISTVNPGAVLSLGSSIQHQKLALFESGNYQWGFGVTTQQFEQYFASDNTANHFSWGSMSYDGNHTFTEMMRLDGSGNVAIGTTDPKGYKLAVNGSAIATSIFVKLNSNWPDYVFKPSYKIPSLTEVKNYININHHLPEIPSAAKIEKDGLNLGEMNKLLTKKVEELTLYLLDNDTKEKKLELALSEEKQKNADQEKRLKALEQKLNQLIDLKK